MTNSGPTEKTKLWATIGIVALVLAMVAATLALLVVVVVQTAYFEFDRQTWFGFVLPPVLWAAFCTASLWGIVRLARLLDRPDVKKANIVTGILAMVMVAAFVTMLYTS